MKETMTNRQRHLNLLEGKPVDRMPAVHFGYWRELLLEWADQGHISKALAKTHVWTSENDFILDKKLGWDYCYMPRSTSIVFLLPPFLPKVIKETEEGKFKQTVLGVIELSKKGTSGIPAEVDYLLKDRESYEKHYQWRLKDSPLRNFGNLFFYARQLATEKYPRGYYYGSAIGKIRNMTTLIGLSYLMYDDPELLKQMVDERNDMQYRCLERSLKMGCRYDYIHIWEDMCFKNGPLISPDLYRELCLDHYKRVSSLAKKYGIKYISVDSDGDIRALAPIFEEGGVNTIFPIEYGTWHLDIAKIREVAPTVYGIGGMNKHVLSMDKAAVDAEIERLKPLVNLGGYIPCPDHLLPPGTKWELVQYYTSEIKKILD